MATTSKHSMFRYIQLLLLLLYYKTQIILSSEWDNENIGVLLRRVLIFSRKIKIL